MTPFTSVPSHIADVLREHGATTSRRDFLKTSGMLVVTVGAAVRSCITPASSVKSEITTLEGLARNGKLHPIQQAWIDEQVPQCGFCQNGQILTAKVLLDKNPHPTDAQIREGMAGALCRCMTYYRVQAAVKRASKVIAGIQPAPEKEVVA